MSHSARLGGGKGKTSVIGVWVFLYMVCQVIKGHALLLGRVWGEFCNILICTLLCDISEEAYSIYDLRVEFETLW